MFGGDLSSFLYSDVSGAALEVLVSPLKLWALNTIAHFTMGAASCLAVALRPSLAAWQAVALVAFILLQIIQVGMTDRHSIVFIDGLFDIGVVLFGWLVTLWALGAERREDG